MAQSRAQMTGFRASLYRTLAGGWYGTKRQWEIQKAGLALLGAFYFMLLVFMQFLVVSEFAMSMIPGWKDSILPPFYTVISFQSGLAIILVTAYAMRRWGGYREIIGQAPFWAASKVLLGLTLLHTYHLFAFFITYWYGPARSRAEQPELPDVRFLPVSLLGAAVLHLLHTLPDTVVQPCSTPGLGRATGRSVHHHRPDAVPHPDLRGGLCLIR